MRVGVAIPNRNHARVLGRLLDSLVPQAPDEIVVVDDASEDNSREVVARYPAVRLVRHPAKVPDHNEALASVASGMDVDYIAMVGADDRLYEGFVDAVRGQEAAVVFCDYEVADDSGSVVAQRFSGFGEITRLTPEQARERLGRAGTPLFECGVGAAVRRDAHQWLVDRGAHRMGPWIDSIGNSILACVFGAVYIPRPLAAFTVSSSGSNWHVQILSSPTAAAAYRQRIMEFFMHPDVYALGPQLLSTIARRWGA